MNLFVYFCIPLIVTGNPTPGTYGEKTERKEDTRIDAQNPETSETAEYSKYAFGSDVGYRASVLDQFVVDEQGEYRRRPLIEDSGAVGKPSLYDYPVAAAPTRASDISDISNIYNTLKDRAIGNNNVPLRGNPDAASAPSYEYGAPQQVAANPALLKLSNYANPLLAAQQYEHSRLKTIASLQTPVSHLAPANYYSQVQQLVPLHGSQVSHQLVQQPLYQNVLVPIYQQSPYAHHALAQQALYQQQQAALHHAAHHEVQQVPLAQQVVTKFQAPLLKVAHAPTILQVPYKLQANAPDVAPILRTAPGVTADIVPAIEEHVAHHEPIALTKSHYAQPIYARFVPSDAVLVSPKSPNVFVQKAIFKGVSSPVLTEKAVLKAALAPVYNTPAYGLQKGIIKAPMLTHFIQNGYLEPGLPTKILSSQKAIVNALISGGGKSHYGHGHGKNLAGTSIELVPSLSYGFSYSLYPKSNGIYGPPQPLVVPVGLGGYDGNHGHHHHHSIKK